MRIALHIPTPAERLRATELLRGTGASLLWYPDAGALCAGMAAGQSADVVVTALRDAQGRPAVSLVRRLRASFPAVPVVGYATVSPQAASDIVEATRSGLAAAVLHGFDDLAVVLQQVVATTAAHRIADIALIAVSGRLTPATLPVVSYCLANAHVAPAVEQIAAALNISRKTMAMRLAADGLPPASALVSWGRVLLAARWLEEPGCPTERVALALGFDSGTGLRHMLARYTGLRAIEIRTRGGLTGVLPPFAAALDGGAREPERRIAR